MDPYTIKLTEMRGYVPFLNKMISKLELAADPTKHDQVRKSGKLEGLFIRQRKLFTLQFKVVK
jgi:hypothetical protein